MKETKLDFAKEAESLARFVLANPAENLTIYCNEVLNASGALVARFNSHAQAFCAVRTVRRSLS